MGKARVRRLPPSSHGYGQASSTVLPLMAGREAGWRLRTAHEEDARERRNQVTRYQTSLKCGERGEH